MCETQSDWSFKRTLLTVPSGEESMGEKSGSRGRS